MLYNLAYTYTEGENVQSKIKFIVEKVSLSVHQSRPKYSADTLIWFSLMYNSSPSNNYRFKRESNTLTLLHPKYLQKIMSN